jgi:hypothetical protein
MQTEVYLEREKVRKARGGRIRIMVLGERKEEEQQCNNCIGIFYTGASNDAFV